MLQTDADSRLYSDYNIYHINVWEYCFYFKHSYYSSTRNILAKKFFVQQAKKNGIIILLTGFTWNTHRAAFDIRKILPYNLNTKLMLSYFPLSFFQLNCLKISV